MVQIPTVFGRSADVVRAAILEHDPDVVVTVERACGQFAVAAMRDAGVPAAVPTPPEPTSATTSCTRSCT
jgi:pyrrolidone-carboxylate peptidase